MSAPSVAPAGGPLAGLRVVEIEGIGPAPFCGMLLADLGADVLRVSRPHRATGLSTDPPPGDPLGRSRTVWRLDLKSADDRDRLLSVIEHADVLIEGFRPGVMERLGLGPIDLHERNPRLVYGRMTGWGQDGPLSQTAGHDINYVALAGALGMVGPAGGAPVPPLNYVGDFGGGGLMLALGTLAALFSAGRTGRGQVVDAAMVDGAAVLSALFFGLRNAGQWSEDRGTNLLDGGAPFYAAYETSDGGYMALGALEQNFYEVFAEKAGISCPPVAERLDPANWPDLRKQLTELFLTRTRDEWSELLAEADACCTPVLGLGEVAAHPHMAARGVVLDVGGQPQPAPAPRFSETPTSVPWPAEEHGDWQALIASWGASAQ